MPCKPSAHTPGTTHHDATMAAKRSQMETVAVVAVPFPAQGHLNQMLHLSLQLASRGLSVHYAAPAPHVRQAHDRVHGWGAGALRSIEFHDLDVAEFAAPPPDPAAPSPFPSHLMPLFEAYTSSARAPLAALLARLSASHRRVVVAHERPSGFAAEEAARLPNVEAFMMYCLAASMLAGKIDAGLRVIRERSLEFLAVEDCATEEFLEFVRRTRPSKGICPGAGILANTCRALEGEFIDVVAGHLAADGKKLFAIGPLNPLLHAAASKRDASRRHECLDWLDKQPPASVLYVSFGSTSSLRAEQITELAAALKGSSRHAKFLSEFTKETEGTGMVVTGWAPQLEILAQGATAAFMSHCGWNSTMESLSHGKPILAWPMHCDQPWDAELVCKHLKAGLLVRPWEKHGEVIPAKAIREVIEEAMVSESGMAVRQRAKELGEAVRASRADGGSSSKDLDEFIGYITRE
ncbi:hypothetical protein ACP4OV_004170 [Aristida adscensionis]